MNKKITELKNSLSSRLDSMTTTQIIELINREDKKISLVIKELIPTISSLIEKIKSSLLQLSWAISCTDNNRKSEIKKRNFIIKQIVLIWCTNKMKSMTMTKSHFFNISDNIGNKQLNHKRLFTYLINIFLWRIILFN